MRIARRLIPAHAGKTDNHEQILSTGGGSSPLTRGKPPGTWYHFLVPRLIPAHAGKTGTSRARRRRCEAHPRSRGENTLPRSPLIVQFGSSPLTRGKLVEGGRCGQRRRLIPAHAGKTFFSQFVPFLARAHPRSRGENTRRLLIWSVPPGSSPLTRGKQAGPRPQ